MKAMFALELIGFAVRTEFEDCAHGLCGNGIIYKQIPAKPYVKEVISYDTEKDGFHLRNMTGRRDYSDSNGSGNRGVKAYFMLESGHYYKVKKQIAWTRCETSFVTVSDGGDIIEVDENDVISNCGHDLKITRPDLCPCCEKDYGDPTVDYTYERGWYCTHAGCDNKTCTKNINSSKPPVFCPMK